MDINHLCPGCMRELKNENTGGGAGGATGRCPYCGFDIASYQQNSRCLPLYSVLAGKYLVGKVLGQGGFGITYMGFDLNMETRIAIKEYFPVELASRDTTTMTGDRVLSLDGEKKETYQRGIQKYVDEARNVSRFSDTPGVVSVKDFFYENDTAYIVMEYIDGISLKDYLKEKGKLTEEETLRIMRPVLEALVKVHEAGIVHRDISPDNIMLTFEDGAGGGASARSSGKLTSVKLIDFGAARMPSGSDQKSLTIILKHGYAPEEQYRTHGEQGPWTDVYALCATMYRMLTGETPVPAMDRLFSDGLKSFEELGVKVSKNTAAAVLKGLAVKKEDRIGSVKELIGAIYEGKTVKAGHAGKAAGDGASSLSRPVMAAALAGTAVLAVLVIGLFAGLYFRMRNGGAEGIPAGNGAPSESIPVAAEQLLQENAPSQADQFTAESASPQPAEDADPAPGGSESGEIEANVSEKPGGGAEEIVLNWDEETLGEQIVFYRPQYAIDVGYSTLICRPDGTVFAFGDNRYGQCRVEDWRNVVAVAASEHCSLGLRSDGTVLYAGYEEDSFADVTGWKDIIQVAAGFYFNLGVTKDGRIEVAGTGGNNSRIDWDVIRSWENVKAIATAIGTREIVAALQNDGTVLIEGNAKKGLSFSGWEKVVWLGFYENYLIGLEEDGTLRASLIEGMEGVASPSSERAKEEMQRLSSYPRLKQFDCSSGVCVTREGEVFNVTSLLQEKCESWGKLIGAAETSDYIFGLTETGEIKIEAVNTGNADLEDFRRLQFLDYADVDSRAVLVGQTEDGRLLTYGSGAALLSDLEEYGSIQRRVRKIAEAGEYGDVCLLEDGSCISDSSELPASNVADIEIFDYNSGFNRGLVTLMEDGSIRIFDRGGAEDIKAAENWKNVRLMALVHDSGHNPYLVGITAEGELLCTNESERQWIQEVDGKKVRKLYTDEKKMALVALMEDGSLQILLSGASSGAVWTVSSTIENWTDLTDLALGEEHILGLRSDGTVLTAGDNAFGQCDVSDWKDIVQIGARDGFSVGLTGGGELRMAGLIKR